MSEFPKITLGDLDLSTNQIAYTFNVSREYALDMGMIEPTPEELAERNDRSRAFHAEQQARRVQALDALEQLRSKDSLTASILDLHSCDTGADWSPECAGCDFSGYEGEPPEWPCRTILALAEHHGIDMPTTLPGRHYEGEFVPSDGKPIEWPKPRWFIPADTEWGDL